MQASKQASQAGGQDSAPDGDDHDLQAAEARQPSLLPTYL